MPYPKSLLIAILLFLAIPFVSAHAQAAPDTQRTPRALLYVTNSASAIRSLRAHVNAMDIVAPQTYAAKPSGQLLGTPSQEVLSLARDAGAQVMPLVVNQDFSQAGMHTLLSNENAQLYLIASLINEAKKQGYIGYQYDFEHMRASDRDRYSAFVARTAPYFKQAHLQLSVAVAPRHSDDRLAYGDGSYDNWTGAFDYAALGKAADFVSVMAYDDSQSVGPTASMPWVEEVLKYSLARIPKEKISFGIPFYAWVMQPKTGKLDHIVGYPAIAELLDSKQYIQKGWSDTLGVSYVTYTKKSGKTTKKLTAWYEDQRSFKEKLALVTDNDLQGFSAWALGLEDPNVWTDIVAMRAPRDGLALAQ